jgi:FAD:protein FMN transferase
MKTNRRQFLRGQAVADAIAKVPESASWPAETSGAGAFELSPTARDTSYLTKISRAAMACQFEVLLGGGGQKTAGTEAAMIALDLVESLESQLTIFRNTSEISRINQTAHLEPITVEPRLFGLLELAAQIYLDTSGAYDITSGPLTKVWGFFRRQGRMPDKAELTDVIQSIGMRHVELNHERQTVRFLQPGVEINLGSIGKGYALDRMAELFAAERIENLLLHGGNSSLLARGNSESEGEASRGWSIGLRHPLRPEQRIGEIRLRDRALGTSGSGAQFFVHDGRSYGHILDPRTGRPAENTLSTTVAAPTAAEADALATAFYVLGSNATIDYCRRHGGISAVVMSPMNDSDCVDITLWGWNDSEIEIYPDDSLQVHRFAS